MIADHLDECLLLGSLHYFRLQNSSIEACNIPRTPFIQTIPEILSSLSKIIGLEALSQRFNVPESLLECMTTKVYHSGLCLACDLYFYRIEKHLQEYHRLGKQAANTYFDMLEWQCSMFWPSSFKEEMTKMMPTKVRVRSSFKPLESEAEEEVKTEKKNRMLVLPDGGGYDRANYMLCVDCGKIVLKAAVRSHKKGHYMTKTANCEICGKSITKHHMKRHKDTVHGLRKNSAKTIGNDKKYI
jgi:hypothetical protein